MNESVDRAAQGEPAIQTTCVEQGSGGDLSFLQPMQSLMHHSSVPSDIKEP